MNKEVEIWTADWVFYIVNGKDKTPFTIQNVVTPKLPNFYLISQQFYLDRALTGKNITFIKSLLKDKATKLPYAKIEFKKYINNSFVNYYE